MRIALISALLIVLAACGSSSHDNTGASKTASTPTSPATSPTAEGLSEMCRKLGRTWAVAADDLFTALGLAVMDKVNAANETMKAATDQLKIEECSGEMVDEISMGNFEAALAAAGALVCSRKTEIEFCGAATRWKNKGEPIVARVKELSAS